MSEKNETALPDPNSLGSNNQLEFTRNVTAAR